MIRRGFCVQSILFKTPKFRSHGIKRFSARADEAKQDIAILIEAYENKIRPLILACPDVRGEKEMADVLKKFERTVDYNVPHGKKIRGRWVFNTYKFLTDPKEQTQESLDAAIALGWCTELCQACMLMMDDIIDGSAMRRGQPCWNTLVSGLS